MIAVDEVRRDTESGCSAASPIADDPCRNKGRSRSEMSSAIRPSA